MGDGATRLQEVLARLDKKTSKSFKMGSEVETHRIETPSVGLTMALGGGWKLGGISTIWGAKSAGKTAFVLQQIALAQREGKVCALFDVETSFNREWAESLGVNTADLMRSRSGTVTGFVNEINGLIKSGVDVIAVDSVSFLQPMTYVEKDGELKPFEDTLGIGGLARSLSAATSQINYMLSTTDHEPLVLMVSQIRQGPKGGMKWGAQMTGGTALGHASNQIVFLSSPQSAKLDEKVPQGDKIIEQKIGRTVDWRIDKDRVGPGDGKSGDYRFYFDSDYLGIDTAGEIIDIASRLGVIKKAGAWYSFRDERLGNGEPKSAAYLRDNPGTYAAIKEALNERLAGHAIEPDTD